MDVGLIKLFSQLKSKHLFTGITTIIPSLDLLEKPSLITSPYFNVNPRLISPNICFLFLTATLIIEIMIEANKHTQNRTTFLVLVLIPQSSRETKIHTISNNAKIALQ